MPPIDPETIDVATLTTGPFVPVRDDLSDAQHHERKALALGIDRKLWRLHSIHLPAYMLRDLSAAEYSRMEVRERRRFLHSRAYRAAGAAIALRDGIRETEPVEPSTAAVTIRPARETTPRAFVSCAAGCGEYVPAPSTYKPASLFCEAHSSKRRR